MQMAEGRMFAQWEQLAASMALLANCHKGKQQRPFTPHDFFRRPGQQRQSGNKLTVDALHALKPMFTKRK